MINYFYIVWDIQTGLRVGKYKYKTRKAATRAADRKDLEFGRHRYAVDLEVEVEA